MPWMMRNLFHFPAKRVLLAFVMFSIVVLNMTAVIGASADDGGAGELVFAAHLDHATIKNKLEDEHDDSCHFLTHHLTWVEAESEYIAWLDREETAEAVTVNRTGLASSGLYRPPIA
jgi:hypothetical protein